MKKKILPKILISIIAITLISAALVSSIFAKYIISDTRSDELVRPASFNVKFDSPNMDTISANFAVDGGGSQLGMTVKRIPYKVTVTSTDSEAAANVTIKLSFNSEMTTLIDKARGYRYYYEGTISGADDKRISCDFEVYRIESDGSKTKLEGDETETETTSGDALTWTSTTQNVLNIKATNKYSIEFLVYHDDNTLDPDYPFRKAEFVSDAVTVDVIATQVDPMN